MIIKKFIFFMIFVSLSNCGYESVFSKRNTNNISIKKIEMVGDKSISRKIISLSSLKENKKNISGYTLLLDSKKIIDVTAKDKSGNASIYRTTIITKLVLSDGDKIIKEKLFNLNFSYNDMTNKFDLSQYQENIEKNLIDKIAQEILIYLNS